MPCGCVLLAYVGLSIWDGLPRTIQYEIEDWHNKSWGLDVDRRTIKCTTAIGADGSRMNNCEYATFHHWLIPNHKGSERSVYLAGPHAGYRIDDANRTARGGECSCSWTAERLKIGDTDCSHTAEALLPDPKHIGTARIAGRRVVRYRAVDDDDGHATDLALVPELGCEVMEKIQHWKGTLGIPGAQWRYVVTSYTAGEPDHHVFQIPPGYSIRAELQ